MMLFGQSYKKMWKQLQELDDKDLPQQVIKQADEIAAKAKNDKEYGHLLKARLVAAEAQVSIAPDSLKPMPRPSNRSYCTMTTVAISMTTC